MSSYAEQIRDAGLAETMHDIWVDEQERKYNYMEKNIKDYLHYYLGCECIEAMIVPGQHLSWEESKITSRTLFNVHQNLSEVKPKLRRLEGMTEDEMKELYTVDCWAHCSKTDITRICFDGHNPNCIYLEFNKKLPNFTNGAHTGCERFYLNCLSAQKFDWLISGGFDVFNLINSRLAIEKQTLTQEK